MLRYIVKRTLLMIPTLFGAAVLVFVLMRLIPGDVCVLRLATGGGSIDPQVLQNCRVEIGTDQPMIVQFWRFISGLAVFDLGKSMWTGREIIDEIGLPWHWGYAGIVPGDIANDLTASVGDPNSHIPETKVFLCNIRKKVGA